MSCYDGAGTGRSRHRNRKEAKFSTSAAQKLFVNPSAGPSPHFPDAVLIHPPNRSLARAIPKPAPQDPKNTPDFVKLDRKTVHPYEKGLDNLETEIR